MAVSFGLCSPFTVPRVPRLPRANAQVILGNVHVSVPMQADARVFVNGEISYAEQLRDGSGREWHSPLRDTNERFVTFVLRLFRHPKYVVGFNIPRVAKYL